MLKVARAIDRLTDWIGRWTSGLVLIMVLVGAWNVAGRHLGRFLGQQLTSNALIEIQWYLFDIVFFLGAAYTLKVGGHVRVDVFYKNWGVRGRAIANLIGTLLFLIPFASLVIYFSWDWTLRSWQILETSPDPGGLPRYPIKSAVVLSFALLIVQGISETLKNLAILRAPATTDTEVERS